MKQPRTYSEKGSAIFFAVLALALLFAVGIGLTTLFVQELRILRGVGDSVVALNAGDAGVERVLYLDIKNCPTSNDTDYNDCDVLNVPCYRGCVSECIDEGSGTNLACNVTSPQQVNFSNSASYFIEIIPAGSSSDCPSTIGAAILNYCIESAGSFNEARRKIEVKR